MDDLSLPIAQQPRLVLLVPFVFMGGAAVCASLAWFLARSAGASNTGSGLAALACIVAGIALGIWAAAGPQGTLRVADRTLVVDARWRRPQRFTLDETAVKRYVWLRGRPSMLVGVYVELSGTEGRTSIGASDIELAQVYQAAGTEPTTVPPKLALRPADLRRLLEVLPAQTPAAGR